MNLSVIEYRGNIVDKHSHIDAVILDRNFQPILACGDIDKYVVPRSSFKPFQACTIAALYEEAGIDISDDRLTLATASHGGMKCQIAVLQEWLEDINVSVDILECGSHPPTNPVVRRAMIAEGTSVSKIHNNNAGRHIAFVQLCQAMGYRITGYNDENHPVQQKFRSMYYQVYKNFVFDNSMGRCGDGSSIPLFTLSNFAKLALSFLPENRPAEYRPQIDRVIDLLTNNAAMISRSEDYFLTRIISAFTGDFCGKEGSNGVCFFVHIPTGFAGAFKVRDGSEQIVSVVLLNMLKHLQLIDKRKSELLNDLINPIVKSFSGSPVGHTTVVFN